MPTDRLQLRLIDSDGKIGRSIAEVVKANGAIVATGPGARVANGVVERYAFARQVDSIAAFDMLAADPWGNTKMVLGAASALARMQRRPKAHAPTNREYVRDDEGKFSENPISKLMSALDARGGVAGGFNFEDREDVEPNRYMEISSTDNEGYFKLETGWFEFEEGEGNTSIGENQVAQITLHVDEVRGLASAMATTMLARESTPDGDDPRSVLLSSLMLAGESGGYHPGDPRSDEGYYETNRNFDWSRRDDGWEFEASSDDTDSTTFTMSDDEFAAMHASLVMTLLEEERVKRADEE